MSDVGNKKPSRAKASVLLDTTLAAALADRSSMDAAKDARGDADGRPGVSVDTGSPSRDGKPSPLDIWSARAAAWAQVVTVFIVLFGYFYTVRPAFQLQLLQEQTAQLQIDNTAATQKLKDTLAAQEKAQRKLVGLDAELARTAGKIRTLEMELSAKTDKERLARREITQAHTEMLSEAESLLTAQRRLLATRFTLQRIIVTNPLLGAPNFSMDETYFDKLQAEWPNPYARLSQALNELEQASKTQHEFPARLIAPLRNILDENRTQLVCEPVDLNAIKKQYRDELSSIQGQARNDAMLEIEKQSKDAAAKNMRLLVTDDDIARSTRIHEFNRKSEINSRYDEKVQRLWDACVNKARPVLDLMARSI